MAPIDKETIRKEIERRIKVAKVEYESTHAPEYEGIDIELNALLAFLDTLEAEENEVDLAEHYKQWVERYKEQHDGDFPDAWAIVNHFYELGCRHTAVMYDDIEFERQRAEEAELSDGLEEAAMSYYLADIQHPGHYDESGKPYPKAINDAFIAGAEWQRKQDQQLIELAEDHAMLAGMNMMKEQMMEKAVEGVVQDDGQFINFGDGRYIDLDPTMGLKPVFELTDGDKVKLIIIPEENLNAIQNEN